MTGLFYAHSGLRYLVLLAGIVAVVFYALALSRRRPVDRAARVVGAIFTGLLDLQIVIGVVLVITGLYYPALVGHMIMMLLAAGVAHGSAVLARGAQDERRHHSIRLVGVVVALALIAGGVLAIGRQLFESGAPSVIG